MNVAVLGGAGFLGSWIARALLADHAHVRIVARTPACAGAPAGAEYICGDFTDPSVLREALEGCTAVIHAGGYYPLFSVGRELQMRHAVSEIRTILDACEQRRISRFVFTSSPMVLVDEERAFRRCAYHDIKRAMHQEVARRIAAGFPGVLVIPGACFGPGDRKPTTGRLILEIAARRLRFFLDGRMNAVDARDVAAAYVSIVRRAAPGACYQLGNWNCTLAEFAAEVARIAGVPSPSYRLPYAPTRTLALAAEWAWRQAGARRPLLPCSGLDQIHYGAHLDSGASVTDLGFSVRPMAATISDTLDWFRAAGYLRTGSEAHNGLIGRAVAAWHHAGAR